MAPPKRRAALGTEASVLEDLVLARDAVGLAAAGADRLAGTLTLLYGAGEWIPAQLDASRDVLTRHIRRTCLAYEREHNADACAVAAAGSVQGILLQPVGGGRSALAIRRQARTAAGCYMADDSLRKRETPVLKAIAHAVYDDLRERPPDELPTVEAAYELMKPYAKVAGEAVEHAVDIFNRETEIEDEDLLVFAAAYAIWGITQVCIFPVYAQQVTISVPRAIELSLIDELVTLLMSLPFREHDDDVSLLVQSIRDREEPRDFLGRLMASGEASEEVARRLVEWLRSCPPNCTYFRSDRGIGYCSPHYYVAACEAFVYALDDLPDGTLRQEVHRFLEERKLPNAGRPI